MSNGKATKFDGDKPRISLIPKDALWEMGKAFKHGEQKYGTFNYKHGFKYTRLADAAMRHLTQFMDGENNDSESGHSHLGHAMASIAMLLDSHINHPELDDRYKRNKDENDR
jgi:hypothetical protein